MAPQVIRSALRFRLLLVGVAGALILLCSMSLHRMHTDVVPELSSGPVLNIQTEALGLSSSEVEQYITVPLENNLLDGIKDVWDIRSDSVPGLSSVSLYFEPGTSELHARLLVQERLTAAFSLPNISKPPLLIQPISSTGRVMLIGLTSKKLSPIELSYLARWVVKPRLSGVPGVANVAIFGQQDLQLQVLVDPQRLADHGITLSQVIATAGNAQLVSPLSYLQGSAPGTGGFIDGPNQRLEVRPVLPLGAPSSLAGVPITGAAKKLQLGAVTRVVVGHQPLIGDSLVGTDNGLVLVVQKLPSASVLGVTRGLDKALDDLRPALRGATVDTSFFRPATYVSSAIDNLELAAIVAAALTLVALAAFCFELRAAFVGLVAIAVSFLTAAAVLSLLGSTLNGMVILGLLVALGVVVDDAVGAANDIVRSVRADGAGERSTSVAELVLRACGELRGALGYATVIVLLAVAPVFFASGLTATFLHPLVLSFVLAVIASMAVALAITPALAVVVLERGRPRRRGQAPLRRIGSVYGRTVAVVLRVPRALLAVLAVVGLASLATVPFIRQPRPPTFKDRNLVVAWEAAPGTSLTEMQRVTRQVDAHLQALPAVRDVGATIGRAVSADQIVDVNSGQIFVSLEPGASYDQAVAAVRRVVGGVPSMNAHLSTYESDVMAGVLAPSGRDVVVRVYGQDYDQLGRLARRVEGVMSQVSGVGTPRVAAPTREPNIEITVNDAAALRAGVLAGDVRRDASTLLSGLTVGNFFEQQAVFDVVVWSIPSVRDNIAAVRNLLVDSVNGGHVRLGQIANIAIQSNPLDIQHEAISRYVDVTARVSSSSDIDSAQSAIEAGLAKIDYPLEYHAEVIDGTPNDPTSSREFLSFAVAAAIGILLLLQAAIGSWRLAALVFCILPLSLAGGLVVAVAAGDVRTLGAYAGLAAVFALATRQTLLVATQIRRLHGVQGGQLTTATVVSAATERAASSMATTLVLAAALLPFVLVGDVAGNEMTHVAAGVMLGGLVSTAILTLLVVPAFCLRLGPTAAHVAEDAETAPAAGDLAHGRAG